MENWAAYASAVVLALSFWPVLGAPLNPSEWRYFSPSLSRKIRILQPGDADNLLAGFCQEPTHIIDGIGLSCKTRQLGPNFSDVVDREFHPKGVIFGHFLSPASDDAAVSAWSAETHPYRWGGTLLLSRRAGAWVPIWYRSAVIIDACEKVALPDQRELLLCEDEDSGMGHALHYLYAVDLERPSDLEHSLLAKAESFKDTCITQTQVLKMVQWRPDKRGFSAEVDTTEWSRSAEPYCSSYPKSGPASLRFVFQVTPEGLRRVDTKPEANKK